MTIEQVVIELFRTGMQLLIVWLLVWNNRTLMKHHDLTVVRVRKMERENRKLRAQCGLPIEGDEEQE